MKILTGQVLVLQGKEVLFKQSLRMQPGLSTAQAESSVATTLLGAEGLRF